MNDDMKRLRPVLEAMTTTIERLTERVENLEYLVRYATLPKEPRSKTNGTDRHQR